MPNEKTLFSAIDELRLSSERMAKAEAAYDKAVTDAYRREYEACYKTMQDPESFGIRLGASVTDRNFKAICAVDNDWKSAVERRQKAHLSNLLAKADHEHKLQTVETLKCLCKSNS